MLSDPIVWGRSRESARCAPPEKAALRATEVFLIAAPPRPDIVGVALSTTPSITSVIADVGTASGQLFLRPPGAVTTCYPEGATPTCGDARDVRRDRSFFVTSGIGLELAAIAEHVPASRYLQLAAGSSDQRQERT